ncbi:Proteasome complex subunit Rpn13 ubiquitin receptor family protein [Candida parapsilosis]|uniref:Pru domain-containing protein n=2 Tax=Candida parapsilosis TaxID=5480 RepID=G8B884_CANPC|nr:uncharacterized protein CPAR2_107040 [Candida parapsilosis]KAF6043035.1 Proteasome complex subunit Rpn13 ubiquitin receptor family protein [Candida parapsilosis]KAF6049387.1 Proteasome complex subunit Rpn13 ubiquitin receptor family protein [Candida parapsilosis]KAF6057238.1 Proteasome complex subunit Rpn13 ubiquitin receptor family protein [Candida parapsilosis]KAF6066043.1 Proteasome complex subunit Rpn13 ubiquitin receptor family protein [Candida parapsilosis]CCE40669.1 hypothetical prot
MTSASKSLKFHAGKVQYNEDTNRCTPLPYEGVISIKPSAEEPDFLDFTWTPKQDQTQQINGTQQVEKDELLLIPGDVTIKTIKSCNTGRVFAFTFLSSGAKYLYWLQDVGDVDDLGKLTEKDNKLIQSISSLISLGDDDEDVEEKEGEKAESMQKQPQQGSRGTVPSTQTQPQFKMPIGSISSVLDISTIDSHLDKLSIDQLKQMYGEYLPPSIAQNPTKSKIIDVVRSGFYQQSEQKLTKQLRANEGAGLLLAQSLKYDYKGEGIENFLNGIRELSKKEKEEEKKKEDP